MNGQHKVAFDYNDLRAIRTARRSLALLAEILEENDGARGAKIGLALDDLLLLSERMEHVLKIGAKPDDAGSAHGGEEAGTPESAPHLVIQPSSLPKPPNLEPGSTDDVTAGMKELGHALFATYSRCL